MTGERNRFDREVRRIRSLLAENQAPLPAGEEAARVRRNKCARDLFVFAKTYFPHYLTQSSSALHMYLYERLTRTIRSATETGTGDRFAVAAPRGSAKSTITTLILPVWCALFEYRSYIVIVSETAAQSADFLRCIRGELMENPRLAQDFPDAVGEGSEWRISDVVTKNGIRIRGAGAGQKLRGMRHGARRPDLVICDDLENDASVVSPEQREKLAVWFFRALAKVGRKYTVLIVVGTILHYDGLLANLIKRPGWKGRTFRSVIRWSQSPLWEKWERIFTDVESGGKAAAALCASRFFAENREAMLSGTAVLWPAEESYYDLMKMRVTEGASHFDSEKQNEPVNPDDCLFHADWFRYWDDAETDLSDLPLFAAVDPSLGKDSRRSDPSAIVGGRIRNGVLFLEVAQIERKHPDQIIESVFTIHKKTPIRLLGVETTAFQQFFKDTLVKRANETGIRMPVKEIRSTSDKRLRINSLQPWIKNGWIRFQPHMRTLIDQLQKFPMGDHDDGPDALEMLKSLVDTAPFAWGGVDPEPRNPGRKSWPDGNRTILG